MNESLKLVAILTIICAVAGSLLAVVYVVTAEPIRAAAQKEKGDAIMKVLPACDNQPIEDAVAIDADGTEWTFYLARNADRYVGAAFEVTSSKGYGGDISIMVGVTADGNVQAIEVLAHNETPGLGAWISGDAFRNQFTGLSIADTRWHVAKDGGDIDQITAATISSRAVTAAVKAGLDIYSAHSQALARAPVTRLPAEAEGAKAEHPTPPAKGTP